MGPSSLATVHKHVSNLEKKGLLTRDYNRSRSIDLAAAQRQSLNRLWRSIQPWSCRCWDALQPASRLKPYRTPKPFPLPISSRSKEVFVLEVRGDSMQDEAILNGDYVLVEKSKTAHNGDIVVALVDGTDATLKRFYREGENVRLQPSNAAMKPIIVPAVTVQIQGKVIGVLRKY